MRVLLSTYGSRGDVEPMAALAAALQTLGAKVVVCAPADQEFADLLARAGIELAQAFMPVRQWIAAAKQSPMDLPRLAATMVAAQHNAIGATATQCDMIVATGLFPSVAAAQSVAELRGIRFAYATFCPLFLPSHHHRPYPYPGHPLPTGVTDNRVLWNHNIAVMDALFGKAVNTHRASIGLPRLDNVRDRVLTDRPFLASDATLWPWQTTDLCDAVQTGAWILPDQRPLSSELLAFLDAGTPPVYVGFGSIALPTVKDAARVAVDAIRAEGRRIIVSQGWAGLGLIDGRDDCFVIGDINQQALFPRVAAVIHHGGAGTTMTATRAGTPQVIVPQVVDQPFWASRVADLGIGAAHDGPAPTVESFSAALKKALRPETRARSIAVAGTVRTDGATVAAKLLRDAISQDKHPALA